MVLKLGSEGNLTKLDGESVRGVCVCVVYLPKDLYVGWYWHIPPIESPFNGWRKLRRLFQLRSGEPKEGRGLGRKELVTHKTSW